MAPVRPARPANGPAKPDPRRPLGCCAPVRSRSPAAARSSRGSSPTSASAWPIRSCSCSARRWRPRTASTSTRCARARAAPMGCKGAAVAAIERALAALRRVGRAAAYAARSSRCTRWAAPLAGLLGGALPSAPATAVTLPEDTAEALYHLYDGGGVTAQGPALLVRKSLADKVSLSGTYYVDMVSNASIDVVTTASPFKETRTEYGVGADYAYRDSLLSVSYSDSNEPDYKAQGLSIDASQEVFGGMTTIKLGFTRGKDDVGKKGEGFFDYAKHWRYRLGATQILTPTWLASLNLE